MHGNLQENGLTIYGSPLKKAQTMFGLQFKKPLGKRQIGSRINGLKQKSSFRVYGMASKKLPVPLGKEL